jgi:hypothetical protein
LSVCNTTNDYFDDSIYYSDITINNGKMDAVGKCEVHDFTYINFAENKIL